MAAQIVATGKSWIDEITDEGKGCPHYLVFNAGEGNDKKCTTPDTTNFESVTLLNVMSRNTYHPCGVYEMRSKPTKSGHSNQCIYDCACKLMQSLPAAGTADKTSPVISGLDHDTDDLRPFMNAIIAGGGGRRFLKPGEVTDYIKKYYEVRPQIVAPWGD